MTKPELLAKISNVPPQTLTVLAGELEKFGAEIIYRTPHDGIIVTPSGKIAWKYKSGELTVTLVEDKGHFHRQLLVGGVKQMIEEAIDVARRKEVA